MWRKKKRECAEEEKTKSDYPGAVWEMESLSLMLRKAVLGKRGWQSVCPSGQAIVLTASNPGAGPGESEIPLVDSLVMEKTAICH